MLWLWLNSFIESIPCKESQEGTLWLKTLVPESHGKEIIWRLQFMFYGTFDIIWSYYLKHFDERMKSCIYLWILFIAYYLFSLCLLVTISLTGLPFLKFDICFWFSKNNCCSFITVQVIFDFRFLALLAVGGSLAGSLLCFLNVISQTYTCPFYLL